MKFTHIAQEQLLNLLENSGHDSIEAIRIHVSGGGCNGMTYGMTFAENINDTDKICQFDMFKVVVDVVALEYLKGCEVDFFTDGLNASFVFNNVFKSVGGMGTCGTCGAAAGTSCA